MTPEREAFAAAVRSLITHAVEGDLDPGVLASATERLEEIARTLDAQPRRGNVIPNLENLDSLQFVFSVDPIIGRSNPIAPPVEVEIDGQTVRGTATLNRVYEGPPGHVHGAVIAGIFDLMFGLANLASGNPGMTGTLTIKYLLPTPLDTPLEIEARTDRIEGRKIWVRGTMSANGARTVEAEGLFLSITDSRAARIFSEQA